ncbi:glycosyltransferase family 2 protein [Anaerohalosphaeraceae bacterium U12dextr]
MFLSVIIPTYNRSKYVMKAIDSVLTQTCRDYEIIIVDDGSTDNTKEVLRPYMDKIQYIYQSNAGVSAARNAGILAAKGEWIAFLDSDDEWFPNKLEAQLEDLVRYPEAVLSCTNVIFEGNGSKPIDYFNDCLSLSISESEFIRKPLFNCYAWTSTVLVKRIEVLNVGLFDEDLTIHEDTDLYFRIFTKGGIVINPSILVRAYRRPGDSDNNLSSQYLNNKKKHYSTLVTVYKKISQYNLDRDQKKHIRKKLSDSLFDLGLYYHSSKNRKQARICFCESFRACPSCKNLIKLLVGLSGRLGLSVIEKRRSTQKGFRRSEYYQHESF